ncbi:right-handed parallel beta-helix repeat-containing protein [Spirochaeta lutea]|uniref:Uncharacterized protein n=1 Tax=Spirochaeta lutea TaxID=1480694 RepID=A0A098R225_9SPIO|nr:right-handed parallel beta-helix repeat-containing protein [Spirochaeta lutea]KGE72762.1 hypothetical protein DC28_05850 [Spirochaeta lutea]
MKRRQVLTTSPGDSHAGVLKSRRAESRRVLAVLLLLGSILLAPGCEIYSEYNPSSSQEIDFLEDAHRLVFGTSTGDITENFVTVNDDETVRLYARNDNNNAGKIAGSEDGITFLFREVGTDKNFKLSADVEILHFGGVGTSGETTSNGQEGFGLMARDYVPQYPGATMADLQGAAEYRAGSTGGSGNMVMLGGIKRGVRAAVRSGVTGGRDVITDPQTLSDASQSRIQWWPEELTDYSPYPTLEDRPDFPSKGLVYRLTLEKNNNGFISTIHPPPGKGSFQEYFIPEPDVLSVIQEDYFYVGLFAARSADILVSNISYSESLASQDAPREQPEPEIFTPEFSVLSPRTNSDGQYTLYARSNVRGYISLRQNGIMVEGAEYAPGTWMTEPTSAAVEPFMLFEVPVYQLEPGDTTFQVMFYPEVEQDYALSDVQPISKTLTVERRSYGSVSTPIYVSPGGSRYNHGTQASPLDIQTAISFVLPGQTIIMTEGTYNLRSLEIPRYNNGRYGSPKRIEAETRDRVFVDFQKNIQATGAVLGGNYWEISGIHIRNTPDKVKGFVVMGSNNLVEWVQTYNHGDTGLQISGRSAEPKSMWPRNNTIRYSESYNNKDAAQTDADGFAAKLTVGEGNRFEWCIAHNNGDDGWDLFTKKETGAIQPVVIQYCIAYRNGILMDGTKTQAGRNGFKLGGEGLAVPHQVSHSLAFQNGAHGFTSNSNPAIQLDHVTSFDNGGEFSIKVGADSRNFTIYDGSNNVRGLAATIEGLLSLYSDPTEEDGTNRREDKVYLRYPVDGFAWYGEGTGSTRGTATQNINGTTLTVSDVLDTQVPLWTEDRSQRAAAGQQGFIRRNSDGTFDLGEFLRLRTGAVATPVGAYELYE